MSLGLKLVHMRDANAWHSGGHLLTVVAINHLIIPLKDDVLQTTWSRPTAVATQPPPDAAVTLGATINPTLTANTVNNNNDAAASNLTPQTPPQTPNPTTARAPTTSADEPDGVLPPPGPQPEEPAHKLLVAASLMGRADLKDGGKSLPSLAVFGVQGVGAGGTDCASFIVALPLEGAPPAYQSLPIEGTVVAIEAMPDSKHLFSAALVDGVGQLLSDRLTSCCWSTVERWERQRRPMRSPPDPGKLVKVTSSKPLMGTVLGFPSGFGTLEC
jgi:hypothetical protein